jgi:hypothetical protein
MANHALTGDLLSEFFSGEVGYKEASFSTDSGWNWKYEPHNQRFKILKLSEEDLEKNLQDVLVKAHLFSQKTDKPIKVMTRIPKYNGIEKIVMQSVYLEGHGYVPVIEEKAAEHFIDKNGKVFDGLTIAWYSASEIDQIQKKRKEIDKEISKICTQDPTNYIDKLGNKFYFRLANEVDAPRISSFMNSIYKKWCRVDPMTSGGVKGIMERGEIVIAEDLTEKNKLIGCMSLVPEKTPEQHYTFSVGEKVWKSNGWEMTDGGLNPKYIGTGAYKGMLQYLMWSMDRKRDREVIFTEIIHPHAYRSLAKLGIPIGENPREATKMSYLQKCGILMRHVEIVLKTGLIDNSPLTNHVVYRSVAK